VGLFGFTTLTATPASPTTATAMTVGDTSEWDAAPFLLLIHRKDQRPRSSNAEVVLVNAYASGTISSMTRAQSGTTALALQAGDECYPLFVGATDTGVIVIDGVSYARTRAGIQAAFDAAAALGGADVVLPGGLGAVAMDGTTIVPKDDVHFYIGPGTWLQPLAGAGSVHILSYTGTVAIGRALTANSARGTNTITIAAGAAALGGIAAGTYVQVVDGNAGVIVGTNRNQVTRVVSVASGATDVVTLEDTLSWDFNTTGPDFIRAITGSLDNFWVEGEFRIGSNTGNTRAISLTTFALNCRIRNVRTSGFSTHANSAAIFVGGGWNLTLENCHDEDSGNSGEAAFHIQAVSRSRFLDSGSYPFGFAWLVEYCSHLSNRGLYGIGGGGRAFKYSTCRDVVDVNPEASHFGLIGGGGGTGYGIQGASAFFTVVNPRAMGNLNGGIYVDGTGCTNLTIIEPEAVGNGSDLYIGDDSPTIKVVGGRFTTVTQSGTGQMAYQGYTLQRQSAVSVTNTVTETAIFSRTIPAFTIYTVNDTGTPVFLRRVRIRGAFNYQNAAGADRSFTFRVKFGGTTLFSDSTGNFGVADGGAFRAGFFDIVLSNDGSNSQVDGSFRLSAPDVAATGVGALGTVDTFNGTFRGIVANGTVAPTADQTFAITIEHSNNDVVFNCIGVTAEVV
jgi:hypothetical protein